MRLGICTRIAYLHSAAEAGFDFAEVGIGELMEPAGEADFARFAEQVAAVGIPVEAANVFLPATHAVTGPAVDKAQLSEHMHKALGRAAELGVKVVVFGSGRARSLPEGFPVEQGWVQLEEACRLAGEIAANYDIKIAMEPLFKVGCNFFNTVEQGIELVKKVNHPNLKLLADIFHMRDVGEPLENVAEAGELLSHIHLATPSIPATGDGVKYDFAKFFEMLRKAGYDGRVSVEDNPKLIYAKHEPPYTSIYRGIVAFFKGYIA